MAYYGVIFPEFWTGRTGRELRQSGKDAQLLALYLATNRHTNMLGLYRLLPDDVTHETGLGVKAIGRGFAAVAAAEYANFDSASSYVWVRSMARFRMGLKPGEALDPDDKRVVAVNRIYHVLDANPFLGPFYDLNHRMLRIKKRRESSALVVAPMDNHNMSGLPSPLEAPSKPVTETEISNRDQNQKKARLTPHGPAPQAPKENASVIRALVASIVRGAPRDLGFADLKDLAKQACVDAHLAYDADVVGSALEQALARNQRAS